MPKQYLKSKFLNESDENNFKKVIVRFLQFEHYRNASVIIISY
jgi:hypothetical protein